MTRLVEYWDTNGALCVTGVPDSWPDAEIEARLRSQADFAAMGYSRSPRAVPVKRAPLLPASTPREARAGWKAPGPKPRRMSAAWHYLERKRESARRNGAMWDRWKKPL
jgi:hypothetical protein